MSYVQVRMHIRATVNIFCNDQIRELAAIGKHLGYLFVGQMLQNLANQAEVTLRQFVLDDIDAFEPDVLTSKS